MRRLAISSAAALLACGCAVVGPRVIERERIDYNEVIARTWNEQMLLNLVRLRYRDTPLFLEVASVSTSYSLDRSASLSLFELSGGSDSRTAGAGIGWSERPTISYTPLSGERFVKQLLSPIPVESLLLLSGSGWSVERVLRCCVQRVDEVWNAPEASGPTPERAPEFERFRELGRLLRELQVERALDFGLQPTPGGERVTLRVRPVPAARDAAGRLAALLGLEQADGELELLVNPEPGERGVGLVPRSLLGTLFFLSQSVDPPAADVAAGRVTETRDAEGRPFDWDRVVGELLRIHSGAEAPAAPYVAVRYRGSWFWIADDDLDSKSTFGLLSQLFNLQAGDVELRAPLLTLPVGR